MENYQAMKTNKVIFYLLVLAVGYACPMWGNHGDDGEKDKTVNTGNILKPITPIDTAGISIIKDPTIHIGSEPVNNTSNYDVGSPKGAFSVDGSGSAIYKISIEAPNGGGLSPSIGVSYNSQSGNGLAGFGFNITGLSCITRGCRDLYHDRQITGISYGIGDALFLDGQRLILKTGTYGFNGSTYTPEGDPYTIVTLHSNINTSACWFSVACANGKAYQLGSTNDSRLSFVNRKGVTCIAAWYINQTTDVHSNLIKYHYTTTNYNLRPVSIEYGLNTAKSRGITNLILFTYGSLTGSYARPFAIGDRQGKMDVCLSKITTQTNGSIFRTYTCWRN